MEINEFTFAGFSLVQLLLILIISFSFTFLIYLLWTWPCGSDMNKGRNSKGGSTILPEQTVAPLYALELEPGTVILQSEDGEFFRILREYDSVNRKGRGSASDDIPGTSSNLHYIPSYTRPHYVSKASAPLLPVDDKPVGKPDPFGDGAPWAPIKNLNDESD